MGGGSGEGAGALLVNDQGHAAGAGVDGVGDAQVCPAAAVGFGKFPYDLIKAQAAGHNGAHHLVGCHAWHFDVGGAAFGVLAGVFAADGAVDGQGAQGAGDDDGFAQKGADLLKHVGQAGEVGQLRGVGLIVEPQAFGGFAVGEFGQGEIWREMCVGDLHGLVLGGVGVGGGCRRWPGPGVEQGQSVGVEAVSRCCQVCKSARTLSE